MARERLTRLSRLDKDVLTLCLNIITQFYPFSNDKEISCVLYEWFKTFRINSITSSCLFIQSGVNDIKDEIDFSKVVDIIRDSPPKSSSCYTAAFTKQFYRHMSLLTNGTPSNKDMINFCNRTGIYDSTFSIDSLHNKYDKITMNDSEKSILSTYIKNDCSSVLQWIEKLYSNDISTQLNFVAEIYEIIFRLYEEIEIRKTVIYDNIYDNIIKVLMSIELSQEIERINSSIDDHLDLLMLMSDSIDLDFTTSDMIDDSTFLLDEYELNDRGEYGIITDSLLEDIF